MQHWYAGPWIWDASDPSTPCWRPPLGMSGIDIRPLPEQAVAGGSSGASVFFGPVPPPSLENRGDYTHIGGGSWYDLKPTGAARAAIPRRKGYSVKGDDLVGILIDLLTDGADPDGLDGPRPLVPTHAGRLELHCGAQRHHERFRWGGRHTQILKRQLRAEFAGLMDDAGAGRLRDGRHHRRVLDYWCEKYGVGDWGEFVPEARRGDVPGRLPHETGYADDFDRADSSTLGASWANALNTHEVWSNTARATSAGATARARYESDLSSADHYSQVSIVTLNSNGNAAGPASRFASGADTNYLIIHRLTVTPTRRLFKVVSGVATQLSSSAAAVPARPYALKMESGGSTQTTYVAGVSDLAVTDTAIAGGLRCGIHGQETSSIRTAVDDWSCADLVSSGILYTQLERSTRGLRRGVYTRWGG